MYRSSRDDRQILPAGKVLGNYTILRLIGQGGYGDIYEVLSSNLKHHALKLESVGVHKQALRREYEFLRLLHSNFFPALIHYSESSKYRYLVMELCGPSFSTVRRHIPDHCFSISTVLRSGIQMLRAIEALHSHGILHRDIKPSNFLIRPSRKYPVALIDYGLSRVFRDFRTGEIIPPRDGPGFVGTSKYASLNAHKGHELGRRDDLFSWFFSLMEMFDGRLPWSGTREKQRIYAMKLNTDILLEIEDMPRPMRNVYRLIRRLEYGEEPNYALLISFMVQAMDIVGASWDDPYEWETLDLREISPISLIPDDSDEEVELPEDLPPPRMPPRTGSSFTGDEPWRTRPSTFRTIYQVYDEVHPRKIKL